MDDNAVIFVLEGEHLEAQAALLAPTLSAHLDETYQKIAYVPEYYIPKIDGLIRHLFDIVNVKIEPLPTQNTSWRIPYPHGNKILACAAKRNSKVTVFLDTDTVLMRPPQFSKLVDEVTVGVVPEGTPTWGRQENRWARAYDFFELPLPTERVQLVRRGRIEYLPYFNAGMVAFKDGPLLEGKNFGQLWLETALEFDHKAPIGGKRPWLDQITLPLTLNRFNIPYCVADDSYNFSISDRDYEPDHNPRVVHYHRWEYFRGWPYYVQALQTMIDVCGVEFAMKLRQRFDPIWTTRVRKSS